MLRLFVNALTADDNYSGSNMQNLRQQFQTPLSEKQKIFSQIFIAFLKCAWNLKHFQKKDEYPSLIISKLLMLKNVATYTSKRSCLRTPFANERANGFQTLLKTARHHYFPLFSSIRGKLICKKSALVWCEILRLFVKTFIADDKYSGSNMQGLPQQFQTSLSQKQKAFSDSLLHFWNVHEI